ncbi:MAG: sensor histidine kinase [Sandaracinaceae bacterium]
MIRSTESEPARPLLHRARDRSFARLVVLRVFFAPVLALVAGTFAFFEPTPWRRLVLAVTIVGIGVLSVEEFVRIRREARAGSRATALAANLILMAIAQLGVVSATGGLMSPVLPGLLGISLTSSFLFEDRRWAAMPLVVQIPFLFALATVHTQGWPTPSLVPELFGGVTSFERGAGPWVLAGTYAAMLLAIQRLGHLLRSIFEELYDEGIAARDRTLSMHAEHSRALSALSAELAHELKNPLASIKGLAALVARTSEGPSRERLGVLGREADRMEGILEELLTFSRPLVPLSLESVSLAQLALDVAQLFEAEAETRSIEFVSNVAPVTLRCDPRKVRQVAINLIQNAMEASPEGGSLEIAVSARGDHAVLRVQDRGRGLSESLADRVFEAGVTDKDTGSGLGLSVCRSLVQQHGGDLTLAPREGGGCVATMRLPTAGPAAEDAS